VAHLDRFQIEMAALTGAAEDHFQQCGYLARRFVLDRFGRFFSCGVSLSLIGRSLQICSLTATNSSLSC
jgi:hypothetical protein